MRPAMHNPETEKGVLEMGWEEPGELVVRL